MLTVIAALLISGFAAYYARQVQRSRSIRAYNDDLLIVFNDISRSLQSGAGLLIAFRDGVGVATTVAPDMQALVLSIERGASLREAIDAWAANKKSGAIEAFWSALSLTIDSGGSHVKAIESATEMLQLSLQREELAKTHATQARASAFVLTLVPVAAAGLLSLTDPSARHFLFGTTAGGCILLVSIALDGIGALWMNRLIRSAT